MYISTPGNHAREESGRSFPALTVDDTDYPLQNVGYHPGQVWWTDVVTGRADSLGTVVVVGDSVSDGWMAYGAPGQRWTDILAKRLNDLPARQRLSVSNAAISGNTVSDQQNPYEKDSACCGQPAVERLWRDALSIPGVRAIILLEGTNDIGGGPFALPSPPAQVIAAMEDIVDRAHARGIAVIGGTLIPMGKEPGSVQETSRRAVNQRIRTSGTFDAVIDFDRMVRWVERFPQEWQTIIPAVQQADCLVVGRTQAAYQTHPRALVSTETTSNLVASFLLGREMDVSAGCKGFSRRAAGFILANSTPGHALGTDVEWPLLVQRAGYSLAYLEVDGLDWESADQFQDQSASLEMQQQAAARYDTDPHNWAYRVEVAREIVQFGLEAAQKQLT
jgi:lysophospholipase L1-like esterase